MGLFSLIFKGVKFAPEHFVCTVQVLKKLTGGVVALVLKRQDSHCRLLRTLARELLACAVLGPVLNFASPGYVYCRTGILVSNLLHCIT